MDLEKTTEQIATKSKNTSEQEHFWKLAETAAEEVNKYPDWKKIRFKKENRIYYSNC